jgi:ATP-dependent RNA/DNA helicase IGHMBP2
MQLEGCFSAVQLCLVSETFHTHWCTVQASGRSLLPMRCTDVEGGFLGKTLLTLIYNRGGSPAEPPPLPTHKLSPHDIVAISSASGTASSQKLAEEHAIAQGVVYRVHDTKLLIAVDDVDDSATLDVPLRLDKLANKVLP